jgi:hypothetical protein
MNMTMPPTARIRRVVNAQNNRALELPHCAASIKADFVCSTASSTVHSAAEEGLLACDGGIVMIEIAKEIQNANRILGRHSGVD